MIIKPLQKFCTYGAAALLALMLGSVVGYAETVQIPVGQQGQDKQNIVRPRAGMKQDQVKAQFGNPVEWTQPVGEPPISKWIYQDFIVVFEYDQVLHSVLIHTPQPSSETESGSDSDALSVISQSNN